MRIGFVALFLLLQDDPFAVLRDPALRARDADRKAAIQFFSSRERTSAPCWAAARFLEKTDREWGLVYDRLAVPGGSLRGRAQGDDFLDSSGQKHSPGKGRLERDVKDPAAGDLQAVLARYYLDENFTPEDHKGALEALAGAIERNRGVSEALDALHLFAMAHLSGLGEAATPFALRLGLRRAGDRWGTLEQAAFCEVARNYAQPGKVDPSLEAAARASAAFDLHRTLERRSGYEAAFLEVAQFSPSGGPRGVSEHLKALAISVKKAIYCTSCKNGKVPCSQCQGKKRVDVPCDKCGGTGRIRPTGATAASDATQRCNACANKGTLRGVPCKGCAGTGETDCGSCNGRPWRDQKCSVKGCRGGRIPCPKCGGKRVNTTKCPGCDGLGRLRAAGANPDSDASFKCRQCDGKGSILETTACADCSDRAVGVGFVRCPSCGQGEKGVSFPASSIFGTDPCGACGGSGWPLPGLAVPCGKCLGLGSFVKPAADPARTFQLGSP
jgi:hypothetical protein